MKYRLTLILPLIVFFFSCSVSKQIAKSAKENVLSNDALQTAHVGISIYEPATGKYWYNYQGDKYFVPASNTKLPTCYAAMKYLGDSLVAFEYLIEERKLAVKGTGDPTFLHSDYNSTRVLSFLKSFEQTGIIDTKQKLDYFGSGWSMDDYMATYMAERSQFPIYGNVVTIYSDSTGIHTYPKFFEKENLFQDNFKSSWKGIDVRRQIEANSFNIVEGTRNKITLPFHTREFLNENFSLRELRGILSDTLHKEVNYLVFSSPVSMNKFYSQPTDSLLKPMMHRSDNFFAEQTLLMVSNELLGVMNDAKIIDTLLKTDFKNLPQKPRWVDGSGLSRYNLFTPQDFVFILNKMKTDFGMDRIKNILPTGNEGTLEGRFVKDSNYIFAKTGTLSGVVSLSGFLYTKKNKLLVFSVLVNNHNSSAGEIRRAVEKFVEGIGEKY
jgi:serine-type D-Ala-D-Ala carboxypeptidase/endopeptidase (penicillin-binding protein 4)